MQYKIILNNCRNKWYLHAYSYGYCVGVSFTKIIIVWKAFRDQYVPLNIFNCCKFTLLEMRGIDPCHQHSTLRLDLKPAIAVVRPPWRPVCFWLMNIDSALTLSSSNQTPGCFLLNSLHRCCKVLYVPTCGPFPRVPRDGKADWKWLTKDSVSDTPHDHGTTTWW